MNMNLSELKRSNCVSIYRCILQGINTIIPIAKEVGICQLATCELLNEMVSREILDMTKPRRNVKGRRIHHFHPSNKFFSVFIEIQQEYISTIGISTSGHVTERFDLPKNYEGHTVQEVINDYVLKNLKKRPNFKYCLAIYLLGDDKNELTVESEIIKTTKEIMIVSAFSEANKAMLFDINGKLVVSIYSHTYIPTVDKNALMSAIPFDEVCTYEGDLYFDCFDALQRIAMKNLENLI